MRIGVDFGGVIVRKASGENSFSLDAGLEIMIPDAFDCIAKFVEITDGNVWVVSKASSIIQTATHQWLGRSRFYQCTGFNPGHICFCSKRSEKADICSKLKLTHFIDDSSEVLQHLSDVVPNLYHFGSAAYPGWKQILIAIEADTDT